MKKAIAAVLALMCVFGAGAVMPQFSSAEQASSFTLTAAAATTDEALPEPGALAGKYKYQYADTSIYTPVITMVKDTEWTDETSKNTYAIYEITTKHKILEEDSKGNVKTTDVVDAVEYHIGLKTINNNTHDFTANEAVTIPTKPQADKEKTPLEAFDEYIAKKVSTEVASETKAKNLSEKDQNALTKKLTEEKNKNVAAKKVTILAEGSFKGSYLKSIDLTGIEFIGKSAFQSCTYITEITIPDSVKYIGDSAFASSGLKTLTVNNDMPVIPASLCASTNLTEIKFAHPEYIRLIGESAFKATPLEAPIFQNWGEAKGYEVLNIDDSAFEDCTSIKSVKISDNISIIGKSVFKNCTSMKSLAFGANTIGADQSCFEGCSALTDIKFNQVLGALGGNAFARCTSLQEVKGMPKTLTNWTPYKELVGWGFGSGMFSGCTKLKTVEFPPSVTVIPDSTFAGCSVLTSVYKAGTEVKDGAASDTTITLVDDSAFEGCSSIRYVNYPNATRLGNCAFKGCSAMETFKVGTCKGETITVNKKETYFPGVGSNALEGCSSLKEITLLSDTYSKYQHTAKQGDDNKGYTFKDCTGATKITISTGTANSSDVMVKTPDGMFSGCTSLVTIVDADNKDGAFSTVTIVSPSTFEKCENLTSGINLPDVRILETNAFMGCTVLKSITTNGNNAIKAEDYGNSCFKDCPALALTVEGNIYTIETGAFQNSGITKVNINGMAGGTVVIGASAFSKCASLKEASIMSGDAAKFSVGATLFADCPNLTKAKYEGNIITQGMFKNCTALTKVCTNATSIKANAFEGCSALTELRNLDDSAAIVAQDIGDSAFKGCAAMITLPSDMNTAFDGTNQYNGCASLTSAKVNALTKGMFAGCTSLKSITLKEGINAIPDSAFQNCTSMESFDLSNMQSIGISAFAGSGLKSVKVNDASSIGQNAFTSCNAIETIDVSATKIGNNAFSKNVSLKKATVSADSIGISAFAGCAALEATGLTLKNTDAHKLTEIGNTAFDSCVSLMGVNIPDTVTKVGTKSFGYNGSKTNADFVIGGKVGSAAQTYAEKNGFTFLESSKFDPNNLPKSSENPTEKTTEKPTEKPTEKTTEKPSETSSGKEYKKGDADGSGEIDILDVITINKAVLGKEKLDDAQNKAADINGDGKPDSTDSLQVLKYIVGIITEF